MIIMVPLVTATALLPTSTLWAWPVQSKWVRGSWATMVPIGYDSARKGPERLRYHSTMPVLQRFAAGLLALSLVVQPLRADDLPELGDVASNELSLATEKKIGQQIMHEIRWREAAYLDDPDVEFVQRQPRCWSGPSR